jgi:hypothetical protein
VSRTDDYSGARMHCVVCKNEIPPERRWDAICCSPECTKKRKDYGRSRRDQVVCRYCYKPSTPEQRKSYQQWRRRPQNPEDEELFRRWREDQVKVAVVETRRANKKAKLEEPAEVEDADTGTD